MLKAVKGGGSGGGGGHRGGHLNNIDIDQSEAELESVDQSEASIQVT